MLIAVKSATQLTGIPLGSAWIQSNPGDVAVDGTQIGPGRWLPNVVLRIEPWCSSLPTWFGSHAAPADIAVGCACIGRRMGDNDPVVVAVAAGDGQVRHDETFDRACTLGLGIQGDLAAFGMPFEPGQTFGQMGWAGTSVSWWDRQGHGGCLAFCGIEIDPDDAQFRFRHGISMLIEGLS